MTIGVIAANGRSGSAVVAALLAAGYRVRAGVRGSHHFAPQDHLVVVNCDATQAAEVRALAAGCDALVSMIGHVRGSKPNVQTEAMKTIVAVAGELRIKRLVSLTGTGVRFPGDTITLLDKAMNLAIGLIDPARVQDGKDHARVMQASGLEWTLIRVLKLTNAEPATFSLKVHGPAKPFVARREVAAAVVQVLGEHSFVGEAPIISGN